MFNLSLTACSFHLRKNNSHSLDSVYPLNDSFDLKLKDGSVVHYERITELFELFFEEYAKMYTDSKRKQVFQCTFDRNRNYYDTGSCIMFYVRIHSGIYGSSSEIFSGDTGESLLVKKPNDIELRPFYLFFFIPKDSDKVKVQKGIMIFQNVGPYGIKTITTTHMQEFFSSTFGVTIRCATISPNLFIKKVIKQDNIQKLVMVKNMKSPDNADNCDLGYGKEVREIGALRFSETKWSIIMDSIKSFAGNKASIFEFEDKDYDVLKVDVDIGGRTRRIDLHNLDRLSIIEAIPDSLQGADGHPILTDLIPYFQGVANEYLSEMVLSIT